MRGNLERSSRPVAAFAFPVGRARLASMSMVWQREAEQRLKKVPFFIRPPLSRYSSAR
jgi:hypothetical protein